jgi:hypothetical protein
MLIFLLGFSPELYDLIGEATSSTKLPRTSGSALFHFFLLELHDVHPSAFFVEFAGGLNVSKRKNPFSSRKPGFQ